MPHGAGSRSGFGTLGLLGLFTVAGPAAGLVVLGATVTSWLPALEELGAPGVFGFGLVLAAFSLVPTHLVALVAGYLLGSLAGAALAVVTVASASGVGFVWLRWAAGARLTDSIESHPRPRRLCAALVRASSLRTAVLLILLRLSPLMPFASTNLLMAAVGMRLPVFLVGSLIGLTPRVVVVAAAGAGLAALDPTAWIERPALLVIGAIATLAALLLIGRIGRRALADAVGTLD